VIAEITKKQHPRFELIRNIHTNLTNRPALVSSLQSFETCLFLIGLARYPAALVSCHSAIEGVLRANFEIGPEDGNKICELLDRVCHQNRNLGLTSRRSLSDFRSARNRIVHHGYSEADERLSALLLLQVGLPFSKRCYAELFQIQLDWRESYPGVRFYDERPNQSSHDATLDLDLNDLLRVALRTYSRARSLRLHDYSYCFLPLRHWMQQRWYWHNLPALDSAAIDDSLENGDYFGLEEQHCCDAEEDVGTPWVIFHCPICRGLAMMFAGLDERSLERRRVRVTRVRCARCGFRSPKVCPFLVEMLLEPRVNGREAEIIERIGWRP
jgi:hypothetical protein